MKKSTLLCCLAVLPLSGCLLNQPSPPSVNQSGTTQSVTGLVILEDRMEAQPVAGFVAGFVPATASSQTQPQSGPQSRRLLASALFPIPLASNFPTDTTSGPQCQVKQGSVSPPSSTRTIQQKNTDSNLLDAGGISFGPVLQPDRLKAVADSQFRYFAPLRPGFPAGPYEIDIAGSNTVTAFSDLLMMPEALPVVKANGSGVTDTAPVIQQGKSLVLEWSAPSVPSAANILVLDVMSQVDQHAVLIHCIAAEDDLAVADPNTWRWELPVTYTSQLLVTEKAQVQFVRANDRVGQKGNAQVEFQGIRSHYIAAKVTQ